MFIAKEDLYSHIRAENAELITRGQDTLIEAAIDGSVAEMRSYMGDYDTDKIFSITGSDRHGLLLIFAKDIAVWHLINLCSNGNLYEAREKRYNRAIAWLRDLQKGVVTPDLPKRLDDSGKQRTPIHTSSNPKRTTHF